MFSKAVKSVNGSSSASSGAQDNSSTNKRYELVYRGNGWIPIAVKWVD